MTGKRVSIEGSIQAAPILWFISKVWVRCFGNLGSLVCAVGLWVPCLSLVGSLCRKVAEDGSLSVSVG